MSESRRLVRLISIAETHMLRMLVEDEGRPIFSLDLTPEDADAIGDGLKSGAANIWSTPAPAAARKAMN